MDPQEYACNDMSVVERCESVPHRHIVSRVFEYCGFSVNLPTVGPIIVMLAYLDGSLCYKKCCLINKIVKNKINVI